MSTQVSTLCISSKTKLDFVPETFLSPWYGVLDTEREDVRLT